MKSKVLNDQLIEQRAQLGAIIRDLHQITSDIGNEELALTIDDLRERLNEPFLFVIVGEVKAGKSSFVNSLLESQKDICKVAPDPCTDAIQLITYGEEAQEIEINSHYRRLIQPIEILKEIAIVDTPGTNTISDHHQEITERFIPGSDLVVFVFEAKNPYRQSAWDFFQYIHEDWQKKVIFILQQSDLMQPDDLEVNINGVKKYAAKQGIENPNVFAVSAMYERHKLHGESGFEPLREYIRNNITGGKAPMLKLKSNIETAYNVSGRIQEGLGNRQEQLREDRIFRNEVKESLDEQEGKSSHQVEILVDSLLIEYDRVTRKTGQDLRDGLGFFTLARKAVASIFSKDTSPEIWINNLIKQLEVDLSRNFKEKLADGVDNIAHSIRQMAKIIDLKIKEKQTQAKIEDKDDIFGDIAERRSEVLKDLQTKFAKFMNQTENFIGTEVFPRASSVAPNLAAGSGMAVIGLVLTAVTNVTAFDITGGVLSALGVMFAGITVLVKRRKIVKGFEEEIAKGRQQLKEEIESKLKAYIHNIKQKIDRNFADFDAMLAAEEQEVMKFLDRHQAVEAKLGELEGKLA